MSLVDRACCAFDDVEEVGRQDSLHGDSAKKPERRQGEKEGELVSTSRRVGAVEGGSMMRERETKLSSHAHAAGGKEGRADAGVGTQAQPGCHTTSLAASSSSSSKDVRCHATAACEKVVR
jgi:hypothetical protein